MAKKEKTQDIAKHKRINDILFGPIERPLLHWLAVRMPAWVNPDILTGFGVFGAVVVFFGYWLTAWSRWFFWMASLGFVINYFGDSLDGTLARVRKIERPKFGFFIDHTTDAFCMLLIFAGMGLSPYVHLPIALMVFIAYLLISVLTYVRMCVEGVFQISYSGIGPTEMRIIAIIINTLLFFIGNPTVRFSFGPVTMLDIIGVVITAVLLGAYIVFTITYAARLSRADIQAREKASLKLPAEPSRPQKALARRARRG